MTQDKKEAVYISNRHTKFTDEKIDELFDYLKQSKKCKIEPITDRTMWKVNGKWLSNRQYIEKLNYEGSIKSKKVNAFCTFSAGDSYDSFQPPQRTAMCQNEANQIVEQLNKLLAASTDPIFSNLNVEIQNTNIDYSYEKKDTGDDGYDTFRCILWLKIAYK